MCPAFLNGAAYVALGANLPFAAGSPVATLQRALVALSACSRTPLRVSAFYHSDPKDCPPGSPEYVNAVAALQLLPDATPLSLLRALQTIEQAEGRMRTGLRNESRTLDLDLLAFSDQTLADPVLVLPHPRAHERRFVLEPWIDVAGADFLLAGRTLGDWLKVCRDPPLRRVEPASP